MANKTKSSGGKLPENLLLDKRKSLPEALRFLFADYPRDMWFQHKNMGELTRFWLSRHDGFRRAATALNANNDAFLEGKIDPQTFSQSMVPGFNALLGGLTEHHTMEDHHYFPKFRVVEPRLARGFEILDSDHHALHDAIENVALTANNFMQAQDRDALLRTSDKFVAANSGLLAFLMRHLEDEEDLIVPLLLDRSEQVVMGQAY
ncbi:MAG: hemerythrin domain-containing protein [Rhizobiaceae bacterium]|nr:hemerythrin domain-containing protein [Rhizobiaceae bacterium]